MLVVRLAVSWNFLLQLAHNLSNVDTWAMFLLRHLANTSFMVRFWASTDFSSVPILGGPASEATPSRRGCPNDSCSHFTQRLFPPKVPPQHTETIYMVHNNIIHTYYTSHLYAHLHLLFYMSCSHVHFFGSSWQADCPWLLVSDTRTRQPEQGNQNRTARIGHRTGQVE